MKAPLASSESFRNGDVLNHSHSGPDFNISSSYLNSKNYSDGAKLIEFKSSEEICSENLPNLNRSDDINARSQATVIPNTNLVSEHEDWLAPFNDYDIDLDSSQTITQNEDVKTPMAPSSGYDIESNSGKHIYLNEAVITPNVIIRNEAGKRDFLVSKSPRGRFYGAAITVKTVAKLTRIQRLKKRARWITKKFIVFMLSHVGLTTLVGLYAVAGGFIFQGLGFGDTATADPVRDVVSLRNVSFISLETFQTIRRQHVDELWNLTVNLNVLEPEEWKKIASNDLHQFERDIFKAILNERLTEIEDYSQSRTAGGTGTEEENPTENTKWTYASALLFAVTVITTIGYGDTVPKSWQAKIVCIVYAIIGIPLTLLCLANIGSLLASMYRFTWKHASHLCLIILRAPERSKPLVETSQVRIPISISVATMVVYILGGAAIFSEWENWSFLEGSYFCFITLSTIGFGDYVPGKNTETLDSNAKRVVCALYLLFGLALLSMIFQLIQDSVTVVVGRYASFLGLSEAQIARDVLESRVEDERKKEIKERVEFANKAAREQLIRDDKEINDSAPAVYPVQVYEICDQNFLSGSEKRIEDDGKHRPNRTQSLPVHGTKRKSQKHLSRLHSVPEENSFKSN